MKLEARLMTCHRGSEDKTPEEAGGYMPIDPYEILNADETTRALIATINYNARALALEHQHSLDMRNEVDKLKATITSRRFKLKAFIKLFK